MAVAGDQQQQRVTAEFEELTTAVGDDLEHPPEHAVQGVDQLLGADRPARFQPLGQRGEAGYVGEAQRAVEHAPPSLRLVADPIDGYSGHVPAESMRARLVLDFSCRDGSLPPRPGRCQGDHVRPSRPSLGLVPSG